MGPEGGGGRLIGRKKRMKAHKQGVCTGQGACEWASSPQNPDVTWAARLKLDIEERKERRQSENDIPGETEEGVHPPTIREGRKAEGQVGCLAQRTWNVSPYLDGH